jgi:hypothetical protein
MSEEKIINVLTEEKIINVVFEEDEEDNEPSYSKEYDKYLIEEADHIKRNLQSYDKEYVESTDNKKVTFKLDNKGLLPVKEYVTIGKDEYEQFKHKYSKSKSKLKQIKRILNIKHV